MAAKEDFTNTQIKEYNRKFERGEEPRSDLRNYTIELNDSGGVADELDKKMDRIDKESALEVRDALLFIGTII